MSISKKTISVVIPTYNCRNLLERCLSSIKWVDEIVIVDMGSTDGTVQLAKQVKANVFHRLPLDGNFDKNRAYGMKKASGDWIMKLDSDEMLSKRLQNEIKSFLQRGDHGEINGLNFYNKILMFGRIVKHGFVKPLSHELRMFRSGKWKYNPFMFHQQITVEGKTTFLKGFYFHYNHRNVKEFIRKMNTYTSLDSGVLTSKFMIKPRDIVLAPIRSFVKTYIIQKGYLDGLLGLEVSMLYSLYNLTEKIKTYERLLNVCA